MRTGVGVEGMASRKSGSGASDGDGTGMVGEPAATVEPRTVGEPAAAVEPGEVAVGAGDRSIPCPVTPNAWPAHTAGVPPKAVGGLAVPSAGMHVAAAAATAAATARLLKVAAAGAGAGAMAAWAALEPAALTGTPASL